jgi:hypothetical protein
MEAAALFLDIFLVLEAIDEIAHPAVVLRAERVLRGLETILGQSEVPREALALGIVQELAEVLFEIGLAQPLGILRKTTQAM